jgi:hypothetical protein
LTRIILILVLVVAIVGTFVAFQALTGESDGSRGTTDREALERERNRGLTPAKAARKPQEPTREPANAPGRYLLFGFVTEGSGDPVPGAEIRATPLNGEDAQRVVTDKDGRYQFELPYFAVAFDVSAKGFLPLVGTVRGRSTGRQEFTIEGSEPNRRDFRLERGAVLAGRVVGPQGEPVAGASVYRIPAEHQLLDAPSLANVTITNERGEYSFPGLADRTADLGVRARGYLPALKQDVKIEGLREVRHDFVLERGREVVATVAFTPLPDQAAAIVVAADSRLREKLLPPGGIALLQDALVGRGLLELPVVSAPQEADGKARLSGLPEGATDLEVQVVHPGMRTRIAAWIAEPGVGLLLDNTEAEVTLRPILAGRVAPTVLDAITRERLHPKITRTSDSDGPFALDVDVEDLLFFVPLDERRHTLKFELAGYQDIDYVLPREREEPHDISIEMQPLTDNQSGSIRLVFDREMKGRVGVMGRGEEGTRQFTATGPDLKGRWLIEKVPPGRWDLSVLATGMIPALLTDVLVVAGQTQEVPVPLSAGGGIELRIEGPDGKLLDKVALKLVNAANEQIDIHFVTMVSGSRGFTSINYIPSAATARADSGMAPGNYVLFAGREGYRTSSSEFVLYGTEVAKVTVRLEKE